MTYTVHACGFELIGREIVEEIQRGKGRAKYGEKVVEILSKRLTERYGNGFSVTTLQYFRKFHLAYPDRCSAIPRPLGVESGGQSAWIIARPSGVEYKTSMAIPSPTGRELIGSANSRPTDDELPQGFSPQLSWSHYRALMRVEHVEARNFYEREAIGYFI